MGRFDERETPLLGDGLGRRQFIGGLAGAGAVAGMGGLLAACGGSSSGGSATPSSSSSSGSAAAGPQKRGGNLRVGLTGGSPTDTLDPHNGFTYLDTGRAQSLYSPLYQLNADAVGEKVLAESIESASKDNRKWAIKLKPGIKFHSGKLLTSADVIYTFKRILAKPYSGASSLGPMDVSNLKADGDLTVIVPFHTPYGTFVDQLAFWYYLYILPEGLDPSKKGTKPDGTGPFKYQSFTPGQRSVFVRNDDYFISGRPFVDQVTIIDFPDPVSLQNALVTGVIDAAGAIEGPQVASLSSNSSIKTIASKTGAITPFTMRRDIPPFNDVNVRQAMRYLVDRQQLIDSALDGFATVAADVFSPFGDPSYTGFSRQVDIPKAKSLLKQAGKEGLTVTLVTSAVATGTVAMATVLAQQAKAAGVTINVKNISANDFFGPTYLKSTFSQDFYNTSPYLAQVAQSMLKASPFNETHTMVPQYQSWYDQANTTASDSVRNDLKHKMREFDFNEGAYIIPAFIDALDAYSTKLAGYTPAKVGQPLSDLNFQDFSFA